MERRPRVQLKNLKEKNTDSQEESRENYTYLVKCADGTYYCGWTTDLKNRMKAHNNGTGAKYTRGRGPVNLVYYETFQTREGAMKREAQIKKMTRERKTRLILEKSKEPKK